MSSYVDELVRAKKVYEMNEQRTIITDRMGPWKEQSVILTWEGESYENNTRDTILVTPDEVEILLKKRLIKNVVRGENGKLYEKMCYADICQYEGAIVCGILAPSTKVTLRQEIIEYAKKLGYVTDRVTPVKMVSGTKQLIFNDDGTYSISFVWNKNIRKKIGQDLLFNFTMNFFVQQKVTIKYDEVLISNLSENEAFSEENIDMFRKYDIEVFFLQTGFDKKLLLCAVMQRAFVEDFPSNILGTERFTATKAIIMKIPEHRHEHLKFNKFGKCILNSGTIYYDEEYGVKDYTYRINVPYTEYIRELMINAEKVLKDKYGKNVYIRFSGFNQDIHVHCIKNKIGAGIERDLLALDYAITFLEDEGIFNKWQLYDSILSLLEMDTTGKFRNQYFSYLKKLKNALPEKTTQM